MPGTNPMPGIANYCNSCAVITKVIGLNSCLRTLTVACIMLMWAFSAWAADTPGRRFALPRCLQYLTASAQVGSGEQLAYRGSQICADASERAFTITLFVLCIGVPADLTL